LERTEQATPQTTPLPNKRAAETIAATDLRSSDPARFASCDSQLTGILRMACRVGSAAYAVSTSYPNKDLDPNELFKGFAAIEAANAVRI